MDIQRFSWQRALAALLIVCLIGRSVDAIAQTPDGTKPPDREAVLELVEKLQSRGFKTRQDASEALWRMGPEIEPILVELTRDLDIEAKQRIKAIRFRFELGLTPEMPAETRSLIMTAIHSGSDKRRREATAALAGKSEFGAVMVVLKRLKSAREQSDYFTLAMVATRPLEPSETLDDFHFAMLRIGVFQPNAQDSLRSIRAVLRDSQTRKRATTKGWLSRLVELVADCPHAAARKSVIDNVYFDSQAIRKVVDTDVLAKWINLVSAEPDRATRYRHISKLLSSSQLIPNGSASRSEVEIEALFQKLTPVGRNGLIDLTSNVPTALQSLHKAVGDEAMLLASSQTDDPAIRGNLRGRLASLMSWPKQKDAGNDILSLIDNEPAGPAKQQVIVGFLEGLARQGTLAKPKATKEIVDSIWAMLNSDPEQAWQLAALLETYGSPAIFADYHKLSTMERMLRLAKVGDRRVVQSLSLAPISKPHLVSEITKHKFAVKFIASLNKTPQAANNIGLYSSLFGSATFTDTISDKEQRREVVLFCNQLNGRSGYYAVSGILRNAKFLKQLISEDQFDNLKSMIGKVQKENNRSDLLPRFLANSESIRFLAKAQRLDEIWEPDSDGKTDALGTTLRYIVLNDDSVTALIDTQQYARLIAVIDKIGSESKRNELLRNLQSRKGYAKQMLKEGKLGERILELAKAKYWFGRRSYISLLTSLTLKDVQSEPELADKLIGLSKTVTVDRDRQEFLRTLVSTEWFLVQLSEQDDFAAKINWVVKNASEAKYVSAIRSLASAHSEVFLDQDRLGVFADAIKTLKPSDQTSVFRSFCSTAHFFKWLKKEDQPALLISRLDKIKDDDLRGKLTVGMVQSGLLHRATDKDKTVSDLIKLAARQSEPVKIDIAIVLLTDYTSYKRAGESELVKLVTSQLEAGKLSPDQLKKLAGSSYALRALKLKGHERKLVDQVLAVTGEAKREECQYTAMLNPLLLAAFTDDEIRLAADRLLGRPSDLRMVSFANSSHILQRLVQLGYFDRLVKYVDNNQLPESTKQSMRGRFYANNMVATELQKRNVDAGILVKLIEQTTDNLVRSQLMHLLSNSKAVAWLIQGYGLKPIQDAMKRMTQTSSDTYILQLLSSNENVVHELEKRGELADLLSMLDLKVSGMNRRFVQTLTRPTVCVELKHVESYFAILDELIDSEQDASRRSMLLTSLRSSIFQDAAIKHGKGDWLFKKLAANADTTPARVAQDFASSSGLYAMAIRHGKYDAAEAYLAKLIDNDAGKQRLIRFCLIRALFDDTYDLATAAKLSDSERYQYFFARATKERDAAVDVLGDPAIQWCDALRQHQWQTLRSLPLLKTNQLPAPVTTVDISPKHWRFEQTAFKIALNQLCGVDDAQGAAELKQWIASHKDSPVDTRHAAEALVATGRPGEALDLLDARLPRRSFYWHWLRLDYDRAMDVIGWDPNNPAAVYDEIVGADKGNSSKRRIASSFMVQVAKCLRDAGRDREAQDVIKLLTDKANRDQLPKADSTDPLRSLAIQLYTAGFYQQSFQIVASDVKDDSPPTAYFSSVYRHSQHANAWAEANVWWSTFVHRYPDETPLRRLQRVHGAMKATTPVAELTPFPQGKTATTDRASDRTLVTRFRYGLYRQVSDALEQKTRLDHSDQILLGRALLAQKDYRKAADAFHAAWKSRASDLTRLYKAGHCLMQASESPEDRATANQYMMKAMLTSLPLQNASGLAAGLNHEGLTKDALRIYDVLHKVAPASNRYYQYAVYRIAEATQDPMVAAPLRAEYALSHLRINQNYSDTNIWLHLTTRLRISQAEMAIEQNDFVSAQGLWRKATQINFANQWIAKSLVPRLRSHDQVDLADRILGAHRDYLLDRSKRFPHSPVIKTRLQELAEISKANP